MKSMSIRLRLTFWYFVVLLTGLGLFGAGMWFALEHRLVAGVDERLAEHARGLQNLLANADAEDQANLVEDLEEFANGFGDSTFVELRTTSGDLVFSSDNQNPFHGDRQSLRMHRSTVKYLDNMYDAAVGLPLTDVQVIMRDFRNLLLLMIPLVLTMAAGGGYWLSRTALAPVDEITRVAKSITVRNLSRRLDVPNTRDELQRMSETWNEVLQRLDNAVQRIKQFTADASHELRTPVALIRATAEHTLNSERSSEYYKESLRTIENEATRMTDLTESLLTLARMDSNSADVPLLPTDLNQVVREIANVNQPAAHAKAIALNVSVMSSPAIVLANESGIRRLLLILLDNALKYTPQGGKVVLGTVVNQGEVTISVCDSGAGIAIEDAPHIFERFYRADKSRSSSGAGLGLAIAQRIAEFHGSKIEVQSTSAAGSCFSLRLSTIAEPFH